MKLKVGLNGFGRIGRAFTRIALMKNEFDIKIINTRSTSPEIMAYLLQNDSVYRRFEKEVGFDSENLIIDGKKIFCSHHDKPDEIEWNKFNVDVVVDATGAFKTTADLKKHTKGNVKKVILTAPGKDDDMGTCVLGVNNNFNSEITSNASCTTNAAAPLLKILHDAFTINSAFLTTAHAYTSSQPLLDDAEKDFTRSRAAGLSIVPTTTGAAKAVEKVIPELKGKLDGMALRVPVPTGSFVDITANLNLATEIDQINQLFKQKAKNEYKGIVKYQEEALVSSDYIGSPYSAIFDSNYTNVINGTMVKICGWYDNEWGYSNRLVDLVNKVGK